MRLRRASWSALILVPIFALIQADDLRPNFDPTAQSFLLAGVINRISNHPIDPADGDGLNLIQFLENYSITEQKAIIRLNKIRGALRLPSSNSDHQCLGGDLYLDNTKGHSFFWDRAQLKCYRLAEGAEILEMLLGEKLDLDRLASPGMDNMILGASRLLFFVAENRQKMVDIADMDPDDNKSSIPSRVFKLKPKENLEIHAYFDNQALEENKMPPPHQIVLQTSISKIIISYQKVNFLTGDHYENPAETKLEFAHLADCLKDPDPVELFTQRDRSSFEFSFRAGLGRFHSDQGDASSLAYSAGLGKLRFELPVLGTRQSGATEVKRQIWDLKVNRVYQSVDPVGGSNNIIDQVLRLDDNQGGGSSGRGFACSVAKISSSSIESFERATPSVLLFGATNFTLTGKTLIRGIDALVYKASDPVLPFWLNSQWTVQDEALERIDRQQSASIGKQPESEASSSTAATRDSTLETTINLAEHDTDHRPLLIEFEWRRRDSQELIERRSIPIMDFAWNLSAPVSSAERPSEIFSMRDLCPTRFGEPAKVRLILSNQKSSGRAIPDSLSADLRDQMIVRALQETLDIQTTSISELESELIDSDDGSMLSIAFKASELGENLVEPVHLGRGKLVPQADKRVSLQVDSFDACFLLASHRPMSVFFGYDFKERICHIDLESNADESSSKIDNSKGFTSSNYGSMHVFRVKHQIDSERLSLSRWIENKFGPESRLVGNDLNLLNGNSTVSLEIRQASIDGHHFRSI